MYRNIVPSDNTFSQTLGTRKKQWGSVWTKELAAVDPVTNEEVHIDVLDIVAKQNVVNPTSTPQLTGRKINGLDEYIVLCDTGQLPSTETKLVPHGIKKINEITGLAGYGISTSGFFRQLPFHNSDTKYFDIYVGKTNIYLIASFPMPKYTKSSVFICFT